MKTIINIGALLFLGIVASAQIFGNVDHGAVNESGMLSMGADKKAIYESKEFLLGVVVNYNVKTGQSAFAGNLARAHNVIIRTDGDITVRFNSNTNDPITIKASEGQMSWSHLEITNIFITTAGANVKIILS